MHKSRESIDKQQYAEMFSLDAIAKKLGTDKSSEIHNYCEKYERYLTRLKRDEKYKILEIGVLDGNSLRMWEEYFFNSEIIGIDINPDCKKHEAGRVKVEIGSQTDYLFLKSVIEKHGPFDLIIDDGSHMQSHMIKSFEILFNSLNNQCFYIVEDTCCAYWKKYEGGCNKPNTAVEYFKKLADQVSFLGIESYPVKVARREDWLIEKVNSQKLAIRVDIESITFLNSLIIITKR